VQLKHSFTVPADLETVWQAVLDPERVAPCMPGASLTSVDGSNFSGTVKVKLGPISLTYKGSGELLESDEEARRVVIKAAGKDSRGNGTAAATVTVTLRADGEATAGSVVTDLSITGKPAQFVRGMISEVGGRILDAFADCLAKKLAPQPEPEPEPAAEPAADVAPEPEAEPAAEPEAAPGAEPAVAAEPAVVAEPEATAESEADPVPEPEPAANGVPKPEQPKLAVVPKEPESEPIDLLSFAGPSVLRRLTPVLVVVLAVLTIVAMRRRAR
jgi:carbon monoxide dehydrogenase subunit G